MERDPLIALEPDPHSHRLSTRSLAEAEARATAGRGFLGDLAAIDPRELTGPERLTHGYLEWLTAQWARAETDFWYEIPIAPYTSRNHLRGNVARLQNFRFDHPGDVDEFIALVHGYAATINEIGTVLSLQASRGVVLSRKALPGAETHIRGDRAATEAALDLPAQRTRELGEPTADKFRDSARQLWQAEVRPTFDRLLDYMATWRLIIAQPHCSTSRLNCPLRFWLPCSGSVPEPQPMGHHSAWGLPDLAAQPEPSRIRRLRRSGQMRRGPDGVWPGRQICGAVAVVDQAHRV